MRKRFATGWAAPVIGVIAAAALGGCAATTSSAVSAGPAPVADTVPSTLGALLAQAGRPDAPTLPALTRTFGRPDLERREGAGAILTYTLESCALVLVFAADPRNEFRLTEASAQPARAELEAPQLADCAAAAEARRQAQSGTS